LAEDHVGLRRYERDIFLGRIAPTNCANEEPLTQYIVKYAEKNEPVWDELTVGIFLDPTLVTKQTTVLIDVDVSRGPGYGWARECKRLTPEAKAIFLHP
jgi:hypothetical protein